MKISEIKDKCKELGFDRPTEKFYQWYRDNVEDYTETTNMIITAKDIIAVQVFDFKENEYRERSRTGEFSETLEKTNAKPNFIQTLELSIKEHQMIRYKKQTLDVQTTNMLLTVYNAINERNKKKFLEIAEINMPLLVKKCWKCIQ